jgi:anti-sigma28 factor (negative regulator of flagellin synthesis)
LAIDRLSSVTTKELVPQANLEGEKTAPKSKVEVQSQPGGDEVQISDKARELNENLENLKIQALKSNEDSDSRIERVKQRIANGFYNQDKILGQIADKVLQSDQLHSVISEGTAIVPQGSNDKASALTISSETSTVRSEKVDLARSRLAEGYYQRSDVVTVTAEKIIKDLFA